MKILSNLFSEKYGLKLGEFVTIQLELKELNAKSLRHLDLVTID